MIRELQRKWSRTKIKRLNLQTQILSKMQIKLGSALRQSDVMLKHLLTFKDNNYAFNSIISAPTSVISQHNRDFPVFSHLEPLVNF